MKYFLLLPILTLMVACSQPESPFVQTPANKVSKITVEVGKASAIPNPKVNILFVVDNSESMFRLQTTMKNNIKQFANAFVDSARLEYKVGVVPVYDRTTGVSLEHCTSRGLEHKLSPLGELVSVQSDEVSEAAYITRNTPNVIQALQDTIFIGTQCGPEVEELFSPVLEVMSPIANSTKNAFFYDKEAYLVIIFLTDADDSTLGLSVDDFYHYLVEAKQGDTEKIMIAAALHDSSCNFTTVESATKIRIPELLAKSGGKRLNICSSTFGKELASFAESIVKRVEEKEQPLNIVPDVSLKLTYGAPDVEPEKRQVLKPSKDYKYEPDSNYLVIQSKLSVKAVPDGRVYIEAYPIAK